MRRPRSQPAPPCGDPPLRPCPVQRQLLPCSCIPAPYLVNQVGPGPAVVVVGEVGGGALQAGGRGRGGQDDGLRHLPPCSVAQLIRQENHRASQSATPGSRRRAAARRTSTNSSSWFQVSRLTGRLWWLRRNSFHASTCCQRLGGSSRSHIASATSSSTSFLPFSLGRQQVGMQLGEAGGACRVGSRHGVQAGGGAGQDGACRQGPAPAPAL